MKNISAVYLNDKANSPMYSWYEEEKWKIYDKQAKHRK